MTDYRLRMIIQGVTSLAVVGAACILAMVGSISGPDAMVILIGTAGFGTAGGVVTPVTDRVGRQTTGGTTDGATDHPSNC